MILNVQIERLRDPREAADERAGRTRRPLDAIRVEHIAKRFGAVRRSSTSRCTSARRVLGLIGDNGAGKSTLIKILSGFQQPDSGTIFVDGEEVHLRSVDARPLARDRHRLPGPRARAGLSVYHNMFLNRELTSGIGAVPLAEQPRDAQAGARATSTRSGITHAALGRRRGGAALGRPAPGDRRSRARCTRARRILLLDEPLAAMGAKEGAIILDLIRDLKAAGPSR